MNIQNIVTNALNRANLSVNDLDMRQMALEMLNEIIQEYWHYKEWKFRSVSGTITTVSGTTNYSLNKRCGSLSDIFNQSMRGTDPYRIIDPIPVSDFYKRFPYEPLSGNPYYYWPGTVQGFSTNPSAASVISVISSFTNYTTGSVLVVNGSQRVVFSGTVPLNYLGASIRVQNGIRAYKLARRDLQSTTVYYLDVPYEGDSNPIANFVIGDIDQRVTVIGYVGTVLTEEEIQLNGSTASATTGSFTTLVKISKSWQTMGKVTATSNAGAVTNAILDPGETDIDIFTVNMYPIPDATETLTYEFNARHPIMSKGSDSPLFPAQYHSILQLDLYLKLITEWLKKEPSDYLVKRRDRLFLDMVDIDNNTDNWKKLQETEYFSTRNKAMNLPPEYGSDFGAGGELF